MKKNVHPESSLVLFRDSSSGVTYPIASTLGPSLPPNPQGGPPVYTVEISASSHPAWGAAFEERRGSRAEAFRRRYGSR